MPHARKGPVWEYFQEDPEDKTKAICQVENCGTRVSRGTSLQSLATSPLLNHLKRWHPTQFSLLQTAKQQEQEPGTDMKAENGMSWEVKEERKEEMVEDADGGTEVVKFCSKQHLTHIMAYLNLGPQHTPYADTVFLCRDGQVRSPHRSVQ